MYDRIEIESLRLQIENEQRWTDTQRYSLIESYIQLYRRHYGPSDEDQKAIYTSHHTDGNTIHSIARKFKISFGVVSNIVSGTYTAPLRNLTKKRNNTERQRLETKVTFIEGQIQGRRKRVEEKVTELTVLKAKLKKWRGEEEKANACGTT